MIEMLGVLAIIGVLSAGGIMGYTTAMENYRVNKFIDDFTITAANAKTFFLKNGNPSVRQGVSYLKLKRLGIIPTNFDLTKNGIITTNLYLSIIIEDWTKTDTVTGKTLTYKPTFAVLVWFIDELSVGACVKILEALPFNDEMMVNVGNPIVANLTEKPSVAKAQEFCNNAQGKRLSFNYLISGRKTVTKP